MTYSLQTHTCTETRTYLLFAQNKIINSVYYSFRDKTSSAMRADNMKKSVARIAYIFINSRRRRRGTPLSVDEFFTRNLRITCKFPLCAPRERSPAAGITAACRLPALYAGMWAVCGAYTPTLRITHLSGNRVIVTLRAPK